MPIERDEHPPVEMVTVGVGDPGVQHEIAAEEIRCRVDGPLPRGQTDVVGEGVAHGRQCVARGAVETASILGIARIAVGQKLVAKHQRHAFARESA